MVINNCLGCETIELGKLNDLQPKNAKERFNWDDIETSLMRYGIVKPFPLWLDNKSGKHYILDGHGLKDLFYKLGANDNYKVPFVQINAKSKKEAVSILLEVFNIKTAKFQKDTVLDIINENELDVNLEAIDFLDNIEQNESNILDNESSEALSNVINVQLSDSEFEQWLSLKERYGVYDDKGMILEIIKKLQKTDF